MNHRTRRPPGPDASPDAASALVRLNATVLLVRRRNAPARGLWAPPGGRIEAGEGPGDAAVRELAEETGLVGTPGRAWPPVLVGDHRIVPVEVEVSRYAIATAADDARDVAWVGRQSIDEWPLAPGVRDLLVRLLG